MGIHAHIWPFPGIPELVNLAQATDEISKDSSLAEWGLCDKDPLKSLANSYCNHIQ